MDRSPCPIDTILQESLEQWCPLLDGGYAVYIAEGVCAISLLMVEHKLVTDIASDCRYVVI